MIFTKTNTSTTSTMPPPPVVFPGLISFAVVLSPIWTFPTYIEWTIASSTSPDGVFYTDWSTIKVVSQSDFTNLLDVNPVLYYKFRYQLRTRTEGLSTWSLPTLAGRPKLLVLDQGETPYVYTVGEYNQTMVT